MPQNLDEAVRWLERAANAGFVPAQFRLAGLNEKGEGVKKDLQAARRLYLAAANKGHAKAMHNLAVLHAEGIDGKPDYKVAAQWFRKAAAYGVDRQPVQSGDPLCPRHRRGAEPRRNPTSGSRWPPPAGDQDAAKKRDEVAARLDQQTLMAAKLAAQTFAARARAGEATSLKAPPGGWDQAPRARRPSRRRARPRRDDAPRLRQCAQMNNDASAARCYKCVQTSADRAYTGRVRVAAAGDLTLRPRPRQPAGPPACKSISRSPICRSTCSWSSRMGLAVGFISGMFGIGGGFLMTPLLIFIGISPAVAVASVASHIAASSMLGRDHLLAAARGRSRARR